ncbi:RNase E inhibitor protein [Actinobacillus lignieresii]|uniref:ribonuclease E inhibitor RraB n=1 Tax=Actinobacillus lignieresii TaxID=720 RepID=UPI000E11EB21|nr:ribonuclease E inhibitor RraB [Actinobacillus lignieresii]SUT94612.1 RNase E inhibitor protein [Actinobacillus lignieresii]VEB25407.1 RNase E inhibitor protein [Actinobacillus lignieresii]
MYDLNELRQETDEIIENLLNDGSDPEALYIIEHHVAHRDFDKLEKLVVDAYKLGYEISEAEEVEEENGKVIFVCDIVSEVNLNADIITAQQKELLPLIEKVGAEYEGWGTYFEDPNAEDDEYGEDGEFFDDQDEDFDFDEEEITRH